MSNIRPTKEYRSREKIKCSYCPGKGRDVQVVMHIKGVNKPVCKNCRMKFTC